LVTNLPCPDIPPKMFVTRLFAVLDPAKGRCATPTLANLLYLRTSGGLVELWARGAAGADANMPYEEKGTFAPATCCCCQRRLRKRTTHSATCSVSRLKAW
jgi:hypothetical protein